MIKYDKMFQLLEANGFNPAKVKKEGILSPSTIANIKSGKGSLNYDCLNRLCYILHCQPADLMEFVPDPEEEVIVLSRSNVKKRGINAVQKK